MPSSTGMHGRLNQIHLNLGGLVLPDKEIVAAYADLHRPTHRATPDDDTRGTLGKSHIREATAHFPADLDRVDHEVVAWQQHR